MTNQPLHSHAYRADIDGLRAIAVLAVVGYHVAPNWLRGGYVGVDIFFVISGFLITGLLLGDAQSGTLKLGDFFARRVRRLFPALLAVIGASLSIGWWLLLTSEFVPLAKSAAAATAFVANVQFWREVGYFDTAAELKPLLHLWSLSVEEQFYLLWPLALLATAAKPARLRRLAWLVLAASLLLNLALVARHGAATFFLPHTRLWELMAGALLAIRAWDGRAGTVRSPRAAEIMAVFGLVLLLLTIFLLGRERHYPGAWALLPVIGTGCLIAAGPATWVARRLLSWRGAVFIGLISYPLYLWHWPLLAFTRIIEGGHSGAASLALALAATFLLAVATYLWIERPVRASRAPRTIWLLLILMSLAGAASLAAVHGWIPARSHGGGLERLSEAAQDWAFPGPGFRRETVGNGLSVNAVGRGPRKILVWGDSNAEQYGPRLEKLIGEAPAGVTVLFATTGSCPPIRRTRATVKPGCERFSEQAFAFARSIEVSTVVLAAQWTGYLKSADLVFSPVESGVPPLTGAAAHAAALAEFADTLTALSAVGKRVVLVLNIPIAEELAPLRQLQRGWFSGISGPTDGAAAGVGGITRASWDAARAHFTDELAALARRHGALVIDPADFLCDAKRCPALDARGEPMYRDGYHLRAGFVREQVRYLDDILAASAP